MQRELTVSQLNRYIDGVFEDERVLHDIKVLGEVSEFKRTASGAFLTLRDEECALSCVCFRPCDDIEVGMSVEALGSVDFYPKSGRVSFVVSEIRTAGAGLLALKLAKLKAELESEGLFANRPPLPERITKIAVLTSEYGAVLHDIVSVVRAKDPLIDICLYDVRVQGVDSADTIAEAVKEVNANRLALGVDAILIARGGGSAYDLQAYNTEVVARAVAASALPVISAVGHETDYTLCDLCASVRAGTPSIAADIISSPVTQTAARIRYAASRMSERMAELYATVGRRVVYRASAIMDKSERVLDKRASRIASVARRAFSALDASASSRAEKLAALAAKLDGVSPLAVLARGYARVTKKGKNVSSVSELAAGDKISVAMKDGSVTAEVTGEQRYETGR